MAELYANGPLSAVFVVYMDLVTYKSGVYQWDGVSDYTGGHMVGRCFVPWARRSAHAVRAGGAGRLGRDGGRRSVLAAQGTSSQHIPRRPAHRSPRRRTAGPRSGATAASSRCSVARTSAASRRACAAAPRTSTRPRFRSRCVRACVRACVCVCLAAPRSWPSSPFDMAAISLPVCCLADALQELPEIPHQYTSLAVNSYAPDGNPDDWTLTYYDCDAKLLTMVMSRGYQVRRLPLLGPFRPGIVRCGAFLSLSAPSPSCTPPLLHLAFCVRSPVRMCLVLCLCPPVVCAEPSAAEHEHDDDVH
jgi:hypothetical protein